MYIPKPFEVTDIPSLHDFMEAYNFATLICRNGDGFDISHIPVLLDRERGEKGLVSWHVAKLNPHAVAFDKPNKAVLIFQGPHAYISPTWYQTSPAVPTWNYAVVHVYGTPQKISRDELSEDLSKMIEIHEGQNAAKPDYPVTDAYKRELLDHIVGFRMEISQIEGKFKLGQNRSSEDQKGMLEGLKDTGTEESLSLARFIESIQK